MTIIRVKGFQIFKDRHGRLRCYHRKSRIPINLEKAPPGSAEFIVECERIVQSNKQPTPLPGTLGALITKYRGSPAFLALAPITQSDYQKVFDYLKPIEGTLLSQFNRALVVRIRDKAADTKGRRFADYVKAVFSLLFAWGSERGFIDDNPATGIKDLRRPRGLPLANRPWSDAERHAVLDSAPLHMKAALAIMMFTGLGPKDALTLPQAFHRQGEIATQRAKTGEPVFWPVPSLLAEILALVPAHEVGTLCLNSKGLPWTLSGFRASWRKVRINLEKEGRIGPGLTLYGLRRTVAVILREMGYDERTIADALGQKTIEMARHYARGADLRPKMRGVVESFDAELDRRRTKAVKPKG